MIEEDTIHLGLRPIDRPLVPWRELRPLRRNSLRRAILQHLDARPPVVLRDELDRFLQADEQFFLATARTLLSMKGALWLDGRALDGRLSPSEAARARTCQRYFTHDCSSLLIHARIVCDRALPVLRIAEPALQISLTSFQDHRRKILSGSQLPASLAPWAVDVGTRTHWFLLVKDLRDDFLVHQGPRHMLFFGQRSDHDIEMVVMVPREPRSPKPLSSVRALTVSPRALVVCVTEFLEELARALPRSTV
jgi:hypothetical protein